MLNQERLVKQQTDRSRLLLFPGASPYWASVRAVPRFDIGRSNIRSARQADDIDADEFI